MSYPRSARRWFFLFVGLLASISCAQQAPVALPAGVEFATSVEGINEYRLGNGLRVLLFADPTKSNITVNVTYMVGSRHEDYGETGMAHLLEHLLFKGSKNHPEILKELKDHGARPNGTTSWDRTNYFETFAATDENLRWALDLEADRMVNSFIAKKDLDSEMTVVRNELEAGENNPQSILMQRATATAFLWHNYGKSTIGARADVERVPIERLQAFYRHFYQPDNAVLVVAGKLDEAKTLAWVKESFGPIPRPTRALRTTYTTEPAQDGERTVTLRRVGDVQAIAVVHHVPAGPDPEFPAVQVATDVLGDNPSGRLYKALIEPGKAASVSAFSFQLKEPGMTLAFASVRQEKSLEEALSAMLDTIDGLKTQPITEAEVNRAKTQWLKNFELTLNNAEQVALNLSNWQAQGDWRLWFLHRDRIRMLTAAEVQHAALKYFIPSNRTVGRFLPEKSPVRAEIPEPPDVAALLKDYKGDATIARGEAFDATPENIDRLTQRIDLPSGLKLSLLPKKTRGGQINAQVTLHHGDEKSLRDLSTAAGATGAMLVRGSARHTREQIKDEFDRLKARVNIFGGPTNAGARITTTRENFAAVLALTAEIMREPAFPEHEFAQLKQAQLAGLENQKSEPGYIAALTLRRHFAPYPKGDVRYVDTLDEQIAAISALTLDEVKAFHRNFYGASHGEVTVIGDFDPAAVRQQIEELFGAWKSPAPYQRVASPYQKINPRADAFETPDKANAAWQAALAVQMHDEHADYPALVLSGYIIGSGMNSRLFARIRHREGLSYGISGSFSAPVRDDAAFFRANAIAAPQNAPKVEASFKDELTQILAAGFTAEEVDAAKKSWLQSREVSRAEDAELLGRLTSHRFWGRTMAWDTALEHKVLALTSEQVHVALRKHLDLGQISYFRAGDFKKGNVTWEAGP